MSARQSAGDRKAQIVAEVLRLADEIGPDRLSTMDVARAVGISQPAIFRHFPTKGALWLAVAEDIADRLQRDWASAEAGASGPQARLGALIEAQLKAISETPALPSILFSRELQVDNHSLRDVFRGVLGAFQGRLVVVLRDMQASGDLRSDVSPEDIAILLTSLVQGVAIRWSLGARGFSLVNEGQRLFDVQMAILAA
ncbi:Nucleoid occlusion factor SlmA [Aliiroseovarius sp. xm-m-379]|jgi:AcrR family transcriptional regulator|uniref:TetR/AcrR family transcriptional regulator n=1 Tax=Paracoccaceae TaxID=31989 RepID=UPI001567EEA5|nr:MULTISPECIES: TetR/AcrR family transcriptional regulator [unclassified Aliiroseovarius]NRP25097.1 Nucleoid occlusion factor SlmA [Aliiroseovarius sp. xm-m-379]NRP33896.1 Nucleoid occlusion factor SlmA [Aliiroseovarius sp. xm-a-104]NRP50575.1 Nucleoid occlusion factor SlmA [Aliiroseovarius sp. xm-m-354]NRQ05327.1 Nucleoid occlusion factor SlmA [Aliiroseovarius sp. xm-m-309]NRQ08532.1 Nucleoid occlusion factor SlmA [Aliiroseovarius sp. xm-v-201]